MVKGRTIVQRIIASSLVLVAACDLAGADTDVEELVATSARSAEGVAVVADMAGSDGKSWVVVQTGEVKGWGRRWCDAEGCLEPADIESVELGGPAVEVSSNGGTTAVLLADGLVESWGAALDPRPVAFDGPVMQLGVGVGFLCARLSSGAVQCTGSERLAAPSWLESTPLPMAEAVDLTAGGRHGCGLSSVGTVTCWGNNDVGQLGSPVASGPTEVALAGEAVDVEAGGDHSCALLVSGAVQCWGSNAQGQLGHAGTGVGSVPLPEPAAALAVGAEHACAVTETSESLYCWGSDAFGQLGIGEDSPAGIRRVDLGDQGATAVFAGAGAWNTFAVLEDGGLRGWGRNDTGQAGYGDLLDDGGDEVWRAGNLPDIPIFRAPK